MYWSMIIDIQHSSHDNIKHLNCQSQPTALMSALCQQEGLQPSLPEQQTAWSYKVWCHCREECFTAPSHWCVLYWTGQGTIKIILVEIVHLGLCIAFFVVNILTCTYHSNPDSKVHGANMRPIWGRQDPGGPHVGPVDFSIWEHVLEQNLST